MNPPRIALKIRAMIGSSIHEVSHQAINVANTLQVTVEFDFNGKLLCVVPGDNYERIVKNYYKYLDPKPEKKTEPAKKVPTKEGWYWFKFNSDSEWHPAKVGSDQTTKIGGVLYDTLGHDFEFGPRIRHPLTDE